MTDSFQSGANWGESLDGDIPGPYDDLVPALVASPRPRPVRISSRGKSTSALVAVVLIVSMTLFFAGLIAQTKAAGVNVGPAQYAKYALPIVFILVIVPLMLVTITRQRHLMVGGEIAMARVTERRLARHGPTIRYQFTTHRGEHYSRKASDGSGQLSAGMNVPIFYDPQNPGRQLALCASFFEVVIPGESQ